MPRKSNPADSLNRCELGLAQSALAIPLKHLANFLSAAPTPFFQGLIFHETHPAPASGRAVDAVARVDTVRVEGANLEKLKVSLDLPSGLFRGSFLHPATKKTVSFGGVIYQRDPNDQAGGLAAVPGGTDSVSAPPLAGGFFLGPIIDGEGWSGDVSMCWFFYLVGFW
jgi:hypothetical protein